MTTENHLPPLISETSSPLSAQVEGQTKDSDGKEAVSATAHVRQNALKEALTMALDEAWFCFRLRGYGDLYCAMCESNLSHAEDHASSCYFHRLNAMVEQFCPEISEAGAPTVASAESGSLVSVEGQTDEGLWRTEIRPPKNGFGAYLIIPGVSEHWFCPADCPGMDDICNAHNAALRAKSEKPQSGEPSEEVDGIVVGSGEWRAVQSSNPLYPEQWDVKEGDYSVLEEGFVSEDNAKTIAAKRNASTKLAIKRESEKPQSSGKKLLDQAMQHPGVAVYEEVFGKKEAPSDDVKHVLQNALTFEYTPWTPPFRYECEGTRIIDSLDRWILDIRGWGFLTGMGSEGLGLPEEEAASIQDALGEHVTKLLNLTSVWARPSVKWLNIPNRVPVGMHTVNLRTSPLS